MLTEQKKLFERARNLFPAAANKLTNLGFIQAKGAKLIDENGKEYLDFVSGIGVTNVGHNHPEVIKAAKDQMDKMVHIAQSLGYYQPYVELAEKLVKLTGNDTMVYFANSGAEAVEGALKLAKKATRRPGIIAFKRSFHGRTLGAASITFSSSAYRKDYAPLLSEVYSCDYPYAYRSGLSDEEESKRCIQQLMDIFRYQITPDQTAAIILEPVQGEGGYIVPPRSFLNELRKICDEYGIALIFDEVQTGFGRTGKMFAYEHFGIKPDIITLAKGMAAGFPLSAIVAKKELMEKWEKGAHGSTFGGNPISCAAAIASIKVLEESGLENAQKMGDYFKDKLLELANRVNSIGDVRGLGLMLAIELVDESGQPDPDKLEKVRKFCLEQGLIFVPCGTEKNIIRFIPPTTVTKEEIDLALTILEKAFVEAD